MPSSENATTCTTGKYDVIQCQDGSFSISDGNLSTPTDWIPFCDAHGGRLRCPGDYPYMCSANACGKKLSDHCCSTVPCELHNDPVGTGVTRRLCPRPPSTNKTKCTTGKPDVVQCM